ncbi:MAG TPA: FtsX-like permease family protein [Longimicrobiaceae bacterium]|nr:FtsX-like permease family protein [Longimicrobiaceae bacterium]
MIPALLLATLLQGSTPEILVERRLAEEVPLAVGDTVALRALASGEAPRPFVVAGTFERAADPSRIARNEYEVRLHLPDLEALLGARDRVDRFAVVLAPGASPDSAARWIEGVAFGTRAYGSRALAEETSATFRVVSRFHRAIGIVTILASAIFLLCVMIIRVDERRRDMGVLRLIGVSRGTVFRSIVLEAVGIAVAGSAAGAGLGIGIARIVNAYYAAYYDTTLRFALVTPRIVLLAALLGLALGAAAGALAAWRVVNVPPQRLGER